MQEALDCIHEASKLDTVVHGCNLSTWEVKVGSEIQHPYLYSELEASQGYLIPYFKKKMILNKVTQTHKDTCCLSYVGASFNLQMCVFAHRSQENSKR